MIEREASANERERRRRRLILRGRILLCSLHYAMGDARMHGWMEEDDLMSE